MTRQKISPRTGLVGTGNESPRTKAGFVIRVMAVSPSAMARDRINRIAIVPQNCYRANDGVSYLCCGTDSSNFFALCKSWSLNFV